MQRYSIINLLLHINYEDSVLFSSARTGIATVTTMDRCPVHLCLRKFFLTTYISGMRAR